MPPKKKDVTQGSFEDSLHRLEQIVEQLEGGSVPLEESMRLYEEGIELSKRCAAKLKDAELTLKRLGKDMDGNFILTDENQE